MSQAARRNQELAVDLARRAIRAAEKRRAEEAGGEAAAERLRDAAGADGRLTPNEALAALGGDRPRPTAFNELLRAPRSRPPSPWPSDAEVAPEPETPAKPEGSADGGEGEPEEFTFDTTVDGQRLRIFDLDDNDTKEGTDQ